tara:strand:+ start:12542 stop:13195 length:654 start_codon:yes stop_codon:yes gene_type:complete
MTYYSKNHTKGQDKFLNERYFKDKKNGFFVDVGAHDGLNGNNSCFFERSLGWDGICVEPLPTIYKQLTQNRKSINIEGAIDIVNGETSFISNSGYTEMLSGIEKYYGKRHFDRRDDEITKKGGTTNVIKVKTFTLESIFEDNNVKHIDYLSIDVEGGEFVVIKSIDFTKVFIDIIGFEDNYPDLSVPIVEYLENNNYEFIEKVGFDIFMINKASTYY